MRLPRFITERLYDAVWATVRSRPSDVNIGKDDQGRPYMQRWHAIPRNKFFNIYLHVYHHDDERILHSHPWWSLSVCVSGALKEFYTRTSEGANRPETHKVRWIQRGDLVWRDADMFHRLEVHGNRTITVFITGRKFKTWYFACKRGLIEWTDFVSSRNKGEVGAGCGEDDSYPVNNLRPPRITMKAVGIALFPLSWRFGLWSREKKSLFAVGPLRFVAYWRAGDWKSSLSTSTTNH